MNKLLTRVEGGILLSIGIIFILVSIITTIFIASHDYPADEQKFYFILTLIGIVFGAVHIVFGINSWRSKKWAIYSAALLSFLLVLLSAWFVLKFGFAMPPIIFAFFVYLANLVITILAII